MSKLCEWDMSEMAFSAHTQSRSLTLAAAPLPQVCPCLYLFPHLPFCYHPHSIPLNLLLHHNFFAFGGWLITYHSSFTKPYVPGFPFIDNHASFTLQATPSLLNVLDPQPHNSPPLTSLYHVVTWSRTRNIKPCEFPNFQMFYSTRRPFRAFHVDDHWAPLLCSRNFYAWAVCCTEYFKHCYGGKPGY